MGTLRLSAEGAGGRGLSPEIWQPHGFIGGNLVDPSRVGFFFDDFADGAAWASASTVRYSVYLDPSCTFSPYTVVDNSEREWGVMRLTQDGTDNDQVSIQLGGGVGGIMKIDPTSAAEDNAVVAFECRIRQSSIANTLIKWFAGLAQEGLSANDGLIADAANTMADVDYVGFWVDEADGDDVMFSFKKTSGTAVATHDIHVPVADTWTKYGFIYDPKAPSTQKIRTYINGAEVVAGRVTNSSTNGTGDTTNFPGAEEMSPILMMKIGAGTACTMDIDWWAAGVSWTD
jgi:hypothetical protein